jgi:hypothetical protein
MVMQKLDLEDRFKGAYAQGRKIEFHGRHQKWQERVGAL